mgnify:CR=1 FL=1
MPKIKEEPTARIHCRVSPGLKEKVETAARLRGQTLTAFTEAALEEKAQEVLQHEERIRLSQTAFLQAIEAPPESPSTKLLAASEDYKRKRS